MSIFSKISTIDIGGLAVTGCSALYVYSTSGKSESTKPKRITVNWPKAKGEAYEDCLTKGKSRHACGWLYSGR